MSRQAIAAAPWTAPSMTSMVTGVYPQRHGYLHWDAALAPGTQTVFDAFARAGHAVASFVFDHIHLFTRNPEATAAFYEKMFDAQVTRSTVGGKPRIDPDKVRALAAGGMRPAHIARELGISRGTVYRFLPRVEGA